MDIFFLLLFGHALGDFGLQSDSLISKKNRKNNKDAWYIYLLAHAIIHGGLVGFLTGSFQLAVAETIAHVVIDFGKCEGKIGLKVDQLLHVVCKLLWVLLIYNGIVTY